MQGTICDICGKQRSPSEIAVSEYRLWDNDQAWRVEFCNDNGSCKGAASIKVESRMP